MERNKPEILSFLIAIVVTLFVWFIGNMGNDAYIMDFDNKELLKDVYSIISADSTINNISDLAGSTFSSESLKRNIIQMPTKDAKINDIELMKVFFALEDQYPKHISCNIVKEANRWNNSIIIVLLFLFSYFLPWSTIKFVNMVKKSSSTLSNKILGIQNDLTSTLNTWSSDQKNQIEIKINKNFVDTIQKFANAHQGFINGMYNNYPHRFTPIFDKTIQSPVTNLIKDGTKSLYIWMEKINTEEYSRFSYDLLELASTSILSTTYFDNNKLYEELIKGENNILIKWLTESNRKADSNFKIQRVHLLKRKVQDTDSNSYYGFLEILRTMDGFRDIYLEKYADNCDYKIKLIDDEENASIHFFGEYIIFDEQIMIRYNEDFLVLELFIGEIVSKYVEHYKTSRVPYVVKSKQNLINILSEI